MRAPSLSSKSPDSDTHPVGDSTPRTGNRQDPSGSGERPLPPQEEEMVFVPERVDTAPSELDEGEDEEEDEGEEDGDGDDDEEDDYEEGEDEGDEGRSLASSTGSMVDPHLDPQDFVDPSAPSAFCLARMVRNQSTVPVSCVCGRRAGFCW